MCFIETPTKNINLSHLCVFVFPPHRFLYFVFLLPLEDLVTFEVAAPTSHPAPLQIVTKPFI